MKRSNRLTFGLDDVSPTIAVVPPATETDGVVKQEPHELCAPLQLQQTQVTLLQTLTAQLSQIIQHAIPEAEPPPGHVAGKAEIYNNKNIMSV
ncbi:hypothetical protein ElyMa_005057600 [Elysia marginata]|uniref:Uncharacterized protein n=1 Tax=Elysia marginata TaxID=1093978 RepID=A0AAV4JDQ9_9GAST|nr:hypothetical protein ElyMa_005057600 [Elysia marginata]